MLRKEWPRKVKKLFFCEAINEMKREVTVLRPAGTRSQLILIADKNGGHHQPSPFLFSLMADWNCHKMSILPFFHHVTRAGSIIG